MGTAGSGAIELAARPRGLTPIEFAGVDQHARDSGTRDKRCLKTALKDGTVATAVSLPNGA